LTKPNPSQRYGEVIIVRTGLDMDDEDCRFPGKNVFWFFTRINCIISCGNEGFRKGYSLLIDKARAKDKTYI
jgi:hypothetical protein